MTSEYKLDRFCQAFAIVLIVCSVAIVALSLSAEFISPGFLVIPEDGLKVPAVRVEDPADPRRHVLNLILILIQLGELLSAAYCFIISGTKCFSKKPGTKKFLFLGILVLVSCLSVPSILNNGLLAVTRVKLRH